MRIPLLMLVFLANAVAFAFALSAPHAENFGSIPLHFEPNVGQTDSSVQFTARTPGMDLYLTGHGTVMVMNGSAVIRMKLPGAKRTTGLQKLPGVSNYFLGNDPKHWLTGVPHYARVESKGIYPGIDVVYYGNGKQVEYDFTVAPGADPDQIRLAFEGPASVKLNDAGDIVLRTSAGDLVQKKPRVYQEIDGRKVEIEARYLLNRNQAMFELARYDRRKPLVIDPMIVYSTYLGGQSSPSENRIAVDWVGAAYVAGSTDSRAFPTQGEIQSTLHGKTDLFITKLSSAGNTVVYSTYLGGSQHQFVRGIAVDAAGAVYLTGGTDSPDFPTKGGLRTTLGGKLDAIAVKLSPSGGALEYSTYLGGKDREIGLSIAVDFRGAAYVTGTTESTDFPTRNALQPNYGRMVDGFVTKINPTGTGLVYSTYLGGSGMDTPAGICVDSSGSAYVAGTTQFADFPTRNAFQNSPGNKEGRFSVFISKLNPEGKALVYSTYVAGSASDFAHAVAIDAMGAVYVAGATFSGEFPLNAPLQSLKHPESRFLLKMNPAGDALVYIRRLITTNGTSVSGLAVDNAGAAYVVGNVGLGIGFISEDLPLVNSLQASSLGAPDAFLAKINQRGNAVDYFTLLGGGSVEFIDFALGDQVTGVAVDAVGDAYITGFTYMDNFPTYKAIFPYFTQPLGNLGRFLNTAVTTNFVTKISNSADIPLTKVTIDPGSGVIYVDGFSRVAGQKRSYFWVPGTAHLLSVGEIAPGFRATFAGWSDGGLATHSVITPANDTTYTAKYDNVQLIP